MDGEQSLYLTREVFGNVSAVSKALFYFLSAAALGSLVWAVVRQARRWRVGRVDAERVDWFSAAGNVWRYVLLQKRVRGRGRPSAAHVLLFGGFCLLLLGTTLIGIEHFLASLLGRSAGEPVFHHGLYYAIYEPVLELAGLALLGGCGLFGYRRWRRTPDMAHEWRDWLVLVLFLAIGLTGYLLEGLRIVREETPWPWLSFVGAAMAEGYRSMGMTASHVGVWHAATWWLHALLSLSFIAFFPYARLRHAIAGTVRLAAGVERLGRMTPVSLEEVEATGEVGVSRIEQFRRRQWVELDACVECGRCDQACPAHEAGKPLSPRAVVQDLRRHAESVVPGPGCSLGTVIDSKPMVGGVIEAETLFSCTACSACTDVCPLGVSPLGFLMEMRRSFVADAQLRGPPAQALQKTERTGNPWGLPSKDRMAWASDLNVPTVQENPGYEVLYWVGCAAAYDRRLQKIARSVVKLLRAAGVNFAVLGNLESCTGESARRMGDELLFQQLARKNLEMFDTFGVRQGGRRILSHCPHCVNSFRQDYAQLGADLDVVHHSEYLEQLLRLGRLRVGQSAAVGSGPGPGRLTYHDPCYLARVQGVTAAPRALLDQAAGAGNRVEMARHGKHTACCGAGGGRMWFDDRPEQRVGQSRIAEALATGTSTLAVSCPFCLTMATDGIAARGHSMVVRDIAEVLCESLPDVQPITFK